MGFDFKLPTTGEKVTLPDSVKLENGTDLDLKGLVTGIIEKSSSDARDQFKPKFDAYESQIKELSESMAAINKEKVEAERQKMTASQRAEADLNDMKAAIERANLEKQKSMDLFKRTKIENDILSAVNNIKGVRNPKHVAKLIALDSELLEDGGSFRTVMNMNGEKRNIETAIQEWFKLEDNAIYLEPSAAPGAGTSPKKDQTAGGAKTMKRTDFDSLSNPEKMAVIKDQIKIVE